MQARFARRAWTLVAFALAAFRPTYADAQIALPFGPEDRTRSPYFAVDGKGPVDALPLKETSVDVRIAGVVAAVVVRQMYENEGGAPIHARYVFPGSSRAAVSGMRIRIGARVIEAEIRERDRARQVFEQAKKEGRSAALLEEARPNVFEMGVANILPGDRIEVELRYSEVIIPSEGVYEFVYPTVVGPRYANARVANEAPSSVAAGTAGRDDSWNRAPYVSAAEIVPSSFDIRVTLSTGLPIRELSVPSHRVDTDRSDGGTATLGLAEGQWAKGDRDFILRYRLGTERVSSGLMLQDHGDERFFMLLVEPPARVTPSHIPPREYVFVLDISGSMSGFPLETAKELLTRLVGDLRPRDAFNVLLFAGGSELMVERSIPASPQNLARAHRFIDGQRAGGGTELSKAISRALELPRLPRAARTVVLITDGYVTAEDDVFQLVRSRLGEGNVFAFGIGSSVNRFLVEGVARAGRGAPFVVTDPAEAAATAERFRAYVTSPVLTDVQIRFEGFEAYDVEPDALGDLFAERPLVLLGRWRGDVRGHVVVEGDSGFGAYRQSIDVAATSVSAGDALPQLWARSRIATLSDAALQGGVDARRDEIVSLGLRYGLLTRYTSFVAVDRIVRNRAGGTEVDQPRPMPHGVDERALTGSTLRVGSEPELWILALAVMLLLAMRSRPTLASIRARRG